MLDALLIVADALTTSGLLLKSVLDTLADPANKEYIATLVQMCFP